MGQIDDETAVRAVGDGSYATRLSANWCIGNNPNGGYAVQPVLRALADLTGRPDPTSVTVHYLRPALGDADATITTAVVRAGRSGTNVTATLIQDDEPRLTVAAIMGDLSTAVSDAPDPGLGVAAPVIPPPEECIDRAELGQGVELPLLSRVEVRVRRDQPPDDAATVDGWIRLRDGTPAVGAVAGAVRRRLPAGRPRQGRAGRLGADAGAHRPRPAAAARRVGAGPDDVRRRGRRADDRDRLAVGQLGCAGRPVPSARHAAQPSLSRWRNHRASCTAAPP